MSLLLGLPVSLAGLVAGVGYALSVPGHAGAPSAHFDGRRFRNALPHDRRVGDVLREGWSRPAWPARRSDPPAPPPPPRIQGGTLRATFVNHATVLVQVGGLNILTDPVWSDACGPLGRLGPRRVRDPGVRLEDLPPIDIVLLSHNHYDHLDVPTLRALHERFRPRLYTGLGNGAFLERCGVPGAVELDWWQSAEHAPGVRVTATEVRHFSGRGLFDRDRTLWCGFHVETPDGALYFSGDTGFGPHFAETARRLPAPRLALLPIGAYLPRAIMRPVHTDPVEAVVAFRDLGAAHAIGIHFGTFPLATDAFDAPPRVLAEALGEAGIAGDRFRALGNAESWEVPERAG